MNKLIVDPKMTNVKKFYFLEYFYILLKSVQQYKNVSDIFDSFRNRKDALQLGESKYRKLIIPEDNLSNKKLMRYEYTFREVIEESESYSLLEKRGNEYFITNTGNELIKKYETDSNEYHNTIFQLMESKSQGFHYLVNSCYNANRKTGLLIFPIYSPPKFGLQKDLFKKTKDIIYYINILTNQLISDIQDHLHRNIDLSEAKSSLILKLTTSNIIHEDQDAKFNIGNYNAILKRVRDYWLNFFLNEIYGIAMSVSYFDIWCYRGKQLGIMNATEFYYNFDGKIVYPTSILATDVSNKDFKKCFSYPDSQYLYIHQPDFTSFVEEFTQSIFQSYIDIKSKAKTYFINLADLRDLVCFKLRISYELFADFLENLYQLNLKNQVRISISLETDKLPAETKAMYLKREPIIIDNQTRNIIAIDIKK